MEPKVIILLATYNRSHLIEETLNSIVAQTYKNWECIIVDDFSSDNTAEVIKSYLDTNSQFFYFLKHETSKKGLSASRNVGLDIAKKREAEFIQFFDDDDLMHPKKIELQVKSLLAQPEAKFSLCGSKNFNKTEEIEWNEVQHFQKELNRSLGEAYLTGKIKFVAQVPLFRYDYAKNFHFDEDLFYAEEWTLFSMDFILNKPKYTRLKEVLFYRRKHAFSITEDNDENFQKRKTSAVTGIKIFNFLDANKVHTKTTLLYFTRRFLLYRFDSTLLARIREIIRKDFPHLMVRFRMASLTHQFVRKIVLRLLKF